jgi:peptidoglycan/xylan/chitin deacetylase (PgdA/CDA1 family)
MYKVGFIKLWCFFHRDKITILTLHGIMDTGIESEWEPLRPRTSRELFDRTLGMAVKYFNFVSLDEAVSMLAGVMPIKSNSCVITFDDGQLNNLQIAHPIFRKYHIPTVFYPTTGFLDKVYHYWFDRLDYAIQQPGLNGTKITIGSSSITIDQSSRKLLSRSLSTLTKTLKSKSQTDAQFQKEVEEIIQVMEEKSGRSIRDLGREDLWSSLMDEKALLQCVEMSDVTIGSHTVNHVRLPYTDDEELSFELRESKSKLENLLGKPCLHFCYPNGDFNDRTAAAVEKAGYASAVTTETGYNMVGDNLYTLKRYAFPVMGSPLKALFFIMGVMHSIKKFT